MDPVEPFIVRVDNRENMGELQLFGEDKGFDVIYVGCFVGWLKEAGRSVRRERRVDSGDIYK